MKIEDIIAEGDRVAVRLTAHAVHEGELMGMPASGKAYTISEIHIFRIKDGKVTEHWREADLLGMMRQLGALAGLAGHHRPDQGTRGGGGAGGYTGVAAAPSSASTTHRSPPTAAAKPSAAADGPVSLAR
jgi:hypothetical protein